MGDKALFILRVTLQQGMKGLPGTNSVAYWDGLVSFVNAANAANGSVFTTSIFDVCKEWA
jgi:hypothetical protein